MAEKSTVMTWGEFKATLEVAGVKDEYEIWYIDVTYPRQVELGRGGDLVIVIKDGTIAVRD